MSTSSNVVLGPNVAELERIRFKLAQSIESIRNLQLSIHANNEPYMVPWPQLLDKYNVILSQSHSLMQSLTHTVPAPITSSSTLMGTAAPRVNQLLHTLIHPTVGDSFAEGSQPHVAMNALLRTMRLPEVISSNVKTVEHIDASIADNFPPARDGRTDEDILNEMERIREEHDYRVERATLAVQMLRDKFDWKRRVLIDAEDEEDGDEDAGGEDEDENEDGELMEDVRPSDDVTSTALDAAVDAPARADAEEEDDDMEMVTS